MTSRVFQDLALASCPGGIIYSLLPCTLPTSGTLSCRHFFTHTWVSPCLQSHWLTCYVDSSLLFLPGCPCHLFRLHSPLRTWAGLHAHHLHTPQSSGHVALGVIYRIITLLPSVVWTPKEQSLLHSLLYFQCLRIIWQTIKTQ